jgi:hypothetical protein
MSKVGATRRVVRTPRSGRLLPLFVLKCLYRANIAELASLRLKLGSLAQLRHAETTRRNTLYIEIDIDTDIDPSVICVSDEIARQWKISVL